MTFFFFYFSFIYFYLYSVRQIQKVLKVFLLSSKRIIPNFLIKAKIIVLLQFLVVSLQEKVFISSPFSLCYNPNNTSLLKGTLLNLLFGTSFQVLNAETRGRTTLGVWLSFPSNAPERLKDKVVILDVEGTDSTQRDDNNNFERRAGLFTLSVSSAFIINIKQKVFLSPFKCLSLYSFSSLNHIITILYQKKKKNAIFFK